MSVQEAVKHDLVVMRIGRVLQPSTYLNWHQAKTLHQKFGNDDRSNGNDVAKMRALFIDQLKLFSPKTVQHGTSRMGDNDRPSHETGFVYRSPLTSFNYGRFRLCLSFSITVCMAFKISADQEPTTNRSKLWYTASVQSDDGLLGTEKDFKDFQKKFRTFAESCDARMKDFYLAAMKGVSAIENLEILKTDIEHLTLQVGDRDFQTNARLLESGDKKLLDLKSSTAFSLLNNFMAEQSGSPGTSPLFTVSSSAKSEGNEKFVCKHQSGTLGLYATTWSRADKIETMRSRFYGVTAAEPESQADDEFGKISHQAANKISALVSAKFASNY